MAKGLTINELPSDKGCLVVEKNFSGDAQNNRKMKSVIEVDSTVGKGISARAPKLKQNRMQRRKHWVVKQHSQEMYVEPRGNSWPKNVVRQPMPPITTRERVQNDAEQKLSDEKKKMLENFFPPSKSTGKWPQGMVEFEKEARERSLQLDNEIEEWMNKHQPEDFGSKDLNKGIDKALADSETTVSQVRRSTYMPIELMKLAPKRKISVGEMIDALQEDDMLDEDASMGMELNLDRDLDAATVALASDEPYEDDVLNRDYLLHKGHWKYHYEEEPSDEEEWIRTMNINLISMSPIEFSWNQEVEYEVNNEEDTENLEDEWLFVENNMVTIFDNVAQFEQPTENEKKHLRPLHIKALIEGRPNNRVLVDEGAAINIVPRAILKRLGKYITNLILTNMVVTDFSDKVALTVGVITLDVQVGSVQRSTLFVVVPTKSS